MNNTAKQFGQTSGSIARNIARKVAEEPMEILKEAGEQITGQNISGESNEMPAVQTEKDSSYESGRDDERSQRLFGALQKEIEDIRKQDLFGDLQAKISQGIEVPLDDYKELSMEQKQVLMAQMEAVRNRQKQASDKGLVNNVPAIHSKPSRRFGAGQKHEAEKQQTRIEKPIPPSG
jgi:hypothetical protein